MMSVPRHGPSVAPIPRHECKQFMLKSRKSRRTTSACNRVHFGAAAFCVAAYRGGNYAYRSAKGGGAFWRHRSALSPSYPTEFYHVWTNQRSYDRRCRCSVRHTKHGHKSGNECWSTDRCSSSVTSAGYAQSNSAPRQRSSSRQHRLFNRYEFRGRTSLDRISWRQVL